MVPAAPYEVARFGDLRQEPWRNGRGVTRRVRPSAPSQDAGADWRLSLAELSGGAPFSHFPGFDRWLLLAQGDEVILEVDGHRRVVSRGQVTSFPGEARVSAVHSDPDTCHVLNLMTRRASVRGAVERYEVDGPVTFTPSEHTAVVVLEGSLQVAGEPALGALDTLTTHDRPVSAVALRACLAVVRVDPSP